MAAPLTVVKQSSNIGPFFKKQVFRRLIRLQHSLSTKAPTKVLHNETIVFDEDVKYPPIKPKYPPGKWGSMDKKYAWLWNSAIEKQKNIPDVKGRIESLIEKETSAISLEPLSNHPAVLDFRQFVTKTNMMDWDDVPVYQSLENEINPDKDPISAKSKTLHNAIGQLKEDITEFLLLEHEVLTRKENQYQNSERCLRLVRLISHSLISCLGRQIPHLKTCQYDEDVLVRSLWSRAGIERKRRRFVSDPDVLLFDTVQDQRIVSEGLFQAMLRSHLPLPMCTPRDSGISVSSLPPKLNFKPSAYGQEKELKKKIDSILAGHRLGDPCEFGLVGFVSTCDSHTIEEQIGAQTAKDSRLAQGLTLTFSWLAAQAINQGFSHLDDLTYPLTSQTVLTDGRMFSFLVYQLNTLELWKDNDANSMVNLCWHSDEMPLYHSVENGKVNELNEDVLWTLLKMFTLKPEDRGYNMKPTLMEAPSDYSLKEDFVPQRVIEQEVVEEEKYIVS